MFFFFENVTSCGHRVVNVVNCKSEEAFFF